MTYEENDSEQVPKKINVFEHDNKETSEEQTSQDEHGKSSENDTTSEEQENHSSDEDNSSEHDSSSENEAPAEEQDDSPKPNKVLDLSDETSETENAPEPEAEPEPSKQEDSVDSVIEHKSFNDIAPQAASTSNPSAYSSRPQEGTAKPIPSSVHNTTDVPKTEDKSKEAPKASFKPTVVTMQKSFNRQYIVYAVVLLVILGLGYKVFALNSDNGKLKDQVTLLNKQVTQMKADPQAIIQEQTDALIAKVGLLTKLPAGETPSVYTVSDVVEAQKQSAFFANAQNGDKTLVYAKAAQAILYRPSTNKVILVAPLSYSNTTTTPAAAAAKPAATTPAATKPAATTPAATTKH